MSFLNALTEDRRLAILILLDASTGYSSNAYVLHTGLPRHGHNSSSDLVRSDLAWLAEQGLVTIQSDPPLLVATLTERGIDVANGRATVPGVKRRGPKY